MATNPEITIEVTEPTSVLREIAVTVPSHLVEKERHQAAKRLARKLDVPGFRKGKVPVSMILSNYRGDVDRETLQGTVPRVYEEALERNEIKPVGQPEFENVRFESDGTLAFVAKVEVRPVVELKQLTGFEVEVPKKTIRDEDVAAALENLRQRAASYKVVERASQPGDMVVIDLVPVTPDGRPRENERKVNQPIELREEAVFPEFFQGLQNLRMGDETEIEITYPEDQGPEERRGQKVTYQVRLKEIKERSLPELDDAFAAQLGEFKSLEELNQDLRTRLAEEEETRFEREKRNRILNALIEANPLEVPGSMVDNLNEIMIRDALGNRYEEETEEAEELREEWRKIFRPGAEREVRKFLLFDSLQETLEIEASPAEIETKIFEIAKRENQNPERLKAQLESQDRISSIRDSVLDRKTYEYLEEQTEITVVEAVDEDASGEAGTPSGGEQGVGAGTAPGKGRIIIPGR